MMDNRYRESGTTEVRINDAVTRKDSQTGRVEKPGQGEREARSEVRV